MWEKLERDRMMLSPHVVVIVKEGELWRETQVDQRDGKGTMLRCGKCVAYVSGDGSAKKDLVSWSWLNKMVRKCTQIREKRGVLEVWRLVGLVGEKLMGFGGGSCSW